MSGHLGREGCYASGCRLPQCREAHRVSQAVRRRRIAYGTHQPRKVSTIGVRRRVQALATLGWTAAGLGAELGFTASRMHAIMHQPHVTREIADRVAALYDRLWDTGPPTATRGQRINAARARRLAARQSWLPPLAWDDDTIDDPAIGADFDDAEDMLDAIAVERAVMGDPPSTLGKAERTEAVRRLTAAGQSAREIGERLGTTSRTIVRDRSVA